MSVQLGKEWERESAHQMKKRRRATVSLCVDQLGCAVPRIQPHCRSAAVSICNGRHARVGVARRVRLRQSLPNERR
jgi:hypothetical protein